MLGFSPLSALPISTYFIVITIKNFDGTIDISTYNYAIRLAGTEGLQGSTSIQITFTSDATIDHGFAGQLHTDTHLQGLLGKDFYVEGGVIKHTSITAYLNPWKKENSPEERQSDVIWR